MDIGFIFIAIAASSFLVGGAFCIWQMIQFRHAKFETFELQTELRAKYEPLEKYRGLHDTEKAAELMMQKARAVQERRLREADAALDHARKLQLTARSLRNAVDGYGDRYLESLDPMLDDLAEEYGHDAAAADLKAARRETKSIIKAGGAVEFAGPIDDDADAPAITSLLLSFFNEKVDAILKRVKAENFGTLRQKIFDTANIANAQGSVFGQAHVTQEYIDARVFELEKAAILKRLQDEEREEQREIRAKIREEQRVQRELKQAEEKARREEEMIAKAVAETEAKLREASDQERAALEQELFRQKRDYEAKLAETERAKSMAEQTRKGTVYVVSNIGSFGENVYKIGLTRRLEPQDRIDELGDASVPFRFDVHAMITSEDSPALEASLHDALNPHRMNKVNRRKEFFRTNLEEIRKAVEASGNHNVHWTMLAEATEYRESLAILAKEKGVDVQADILHPTKRAEDVLESVIE